MDDAQTVAELLSRIHREFAAAGLFPSPGFRDREDEAAYLIAHVIGAEPSLRTYQLTRRLSAREAAAIADLVERRLATRRPIGQLIGETWFAGRKFLVNDRVMIPRSPIAEVIHDRFKPWYADPVGCLLDLCTGSGCLAVTAALAFPEAQVVATDISAPALAVAARNLHDAGLDDRVTLSKSDLFESISAARFDVILANPPYVPREREPDLPPEYRYEPALALFADDDGLALVLAILRDAGSHLTDRGVLFLEVGESWPSLDRRLARLPLTWVELANGGEGVLVASRAELIRWRPTLIAASRS